MGMETLATEQMSTGNDSERKRRESPKGTEAKVGSVEPMELELAIRKYDSTLTQTVPNKDPCISNKSTLSEYRPRAFEEVEDCFQPFEVSSPEVLFSLAIH